MASRKREDIDRPIFDNLKRLHDESAEPEDVNSISHRLEIGFMLMEADDLPDDDPETIPVDPHHFFTRGKTKLGPPSNN